MGLTAIKPSNAYFSLQSTPSSNQAYISAVGGETVTISGPPSTLEQILCYSESLKSRHLELPVYGPYHASHLHKGVDKGQFLSSNNFPSPEFWNSYRLTLPLRSTSDGKYFDHGLDTITLLTQIIHEVIDDTIRLDKIIGGCVEQLALHQYDCGVILCGPTRAYTALANALRSQGNANVLVQSLANPNISPATEWAPRTSRKPKLAIVGMAGRFPNAADHEKFWELLEAGIDLHRKVFLHSTLTMEKELTLYDLRYLQTVSTLRSTTIQLAKPAIPAIPHSDASLMSLVSSTHVSSTCLHVKPLRPTLCIDLVSPVHTRLWRWPGMCPIERLPLG